MGIEMNIQVVSPLGLQLFPDGGDSTAVRPDAFLQGLLESPRLQYSFVGEVYFKMGIMSSGN
jgi:hypothetical protein